MKTVMIPSLTLFGMAILLAGFVVWTEASDSSDARQNESGDGYYVDEFRRASQ